MPDLDSSLFSIAQPTGQPRRGDLLVAEPFLREGYFNHAVIALVDYGDAAPTMGLVLNKPTGYTLGEVIEGIDDEVNLPICCGGPLSCDRLFYLHTMPEQLPDSRRVSNGLYIGGDFDRVKAYVNMGLPTEGRIRFFVGYSGWDPGQLEDEITRHVWAVAPRPAKAEVLREEGDSFWYRTVRGMGPAYRNWLYHPVNPQYN